MDEIRLSNGKSGTGTSQIAIALDGRTVLRANRVQDSGGTNGGGLCLHQ